MVTVVDVVGLSLWGTKGVGGVQAADADSYAGPSPLSPSSAADLALDSDLSDDQGATVTTMAASKRLLELLTTLLARAGSWRQRYAEAVLKEMGSLLPDIVDRDVSTAPAGRGMASFAAPSEGAFDLSSAGLDRMPHEPAPAASIAEVKEQASSSPGAGWMPALPDGAHPHEIVMLQSTQDAASSQNGSARASHTPVSAVLPAGASTSDAGGADIASLPRPSIARGPDVDSSRQPDLQFLLRPWPNATAATSDGRGDMQERARTAVRWFEARGYTREQAVGAVATLQTASGMNPAAVGDDGQTYGLGQWPTGRQADFRRSQGMDIQGSSVDQQLAFVDWELRHTQSNAGRQLSAVATPQAAAEVTARLYERPADDEGEARRRAAAAQTLYREMYADEIGAGSAVDISNAAGAASGNGGQGATTQSAAATMTSINGPVYVQTQAIDAQGIANDLSATLRDQAMAFQLNSGLR